MGLLVSILILLKFFTQASAWSILLFSWESILAIINPTLPLIWASQVAFSKDFALGEVVEVVEDQFSELGAEDGDNFLGLEAMGFPLFEKEGKKYYNTLLNPHVSPFASWKKVTGITINTVHGNESSISKLLKRAEVVVESMEGAAFFQACLLQEDVKFYAIRSISNYVERRDRSKWNIPLALSTVQNLLFQKFRESIL